MDSAPLSVADIGADLYGQRLIQSDLTEYAADPWQTKSAAHFVGKFYREVKYMVYVSQWPTKVYIYKYMINKMAFDFHGANEWMV